MTSLRFSIWRASGSRFSFFFFPFGSPFTRDMLLSTCMMKSSAWSTMRVSESFCADSCVASSVCCSAAAAAAAAAVLSARLCSGEGPQAASASADNVANDVRRGVFIGGGMCGAERCPGRTTVPEASGGGTPKLQRPRTPRVVMAHTLSVIQRTGDVLGRLYVTERASRAGL